MSTYTDLHNKIKENINVDYHDRITPQEVRFLNPRNEFLGKFKGLVDIKGGVIDEIFIKNSVLENVKFKNGLVLDSITDDIIYLSDQLSTEINNRKDNDYYIIDKLSTEIENRQLADITEYNRALSAEEYLSKKIKQETENRIQSDECLKYELTDKILKDRHFKLNAISGRKYPIQLEDYAVNTYKACAPNAYVYSNNDYQNPIGKIQNSKYNEEDNDIKYESFDLFAFENTFAYELTAYGKTVFHFDINNTTIYTGVGGYRIEWQNPGCNKDEKLLFLIDSNNKQGFYSVKFDESLNEAGLLAAGPENITIDNDGIVQKCKFTVTSHELSNFVRPYPYDLSNNTKTYITGLDSSKCEILLSSNHFILKDGSIKRNLIELSDNNDVFGKIYENNIIIGGFGELKEINVNIDSREYLLNEANNFTQNIKGGSQYKIVKFDITDRKVKIIDDKKKFEYAFIGNSSILIPGEEDEYNKTIYDQVDNIIVKLNFDTEDEPYFHANYNLKRDLTTHNIFSCEDKFDDTYIKLVYNSFEYKLDIFINCPTTQSKGHIGLTLNQKDYEIKYFSSLIYKSQEIDVNNPHYDSFEETSKNIYFLHVNPRNQEMSGETKEYQAEADYKLKDNIDILLPDKKHDIPQPFEHVAMQYWINFKISDSGRYNLDKNVVRLNLISHDQHDRFYFLNKPVKNIYLVKNFYSTLKFEEVQPHRFIITDMDYSELDFKTKWLRDRLSVDEISICADINYLSSEISSNDNDICYLSNVVEQISCDLYSMDTSLSGRVISCENAISDIYKQIKGGLSYKGILNLSSNPTTFYKLFYDKYYNGQALSDLNNIPLRAGFYYIAKADDKILHYDVEGQKVTDGDMLIVNNNCLLKDISLSKIDIIDMMDKDCVRLSTFVETSSYLDDKINFILSVEHDNVSYQGTLKKYVPVFPEFIGTLSNFINQSLNPQFEGKLKNGFLFHLSANQTALSDKYNSSITFGENDYLLINKNINVSDIALSDIDIIRDAKFEVESAYIEFKKELSVISTDLEQKITDNSNNISSLSIFIDDLSTDLSSEIEALSDSLSNTTRISVEQLQNQIISNDNDISILTDKVEFILSVDKETMNYKGTLPYYDVPGNQMLSAFIAQANIPNNKLKLGDTFKLSATQYELFDALGNKVYLGSKDYFIVNKNCIIYTVTTSDIDIFRNAETNVELLSIALSNDIMNLSSNISNDVELSVNNLIDKHDENTILITTICCNISNDIKCLSVNISNDINSISTNISTEISALELSVCEISSNLNSLNSHYDKTFQKDYHVDQFGSDVSVDLLTITSEDLNGIKYTMHLSAGTLVLIPIKK